MSEETQSSPEPGRVLTKLSGHALIDARSLAMGELTAQHLRERPELMLVAQRMLACWQEQCSANVQPVLREWQMILDAGLEETTATLTGIDERHVRFRQSAPFAGENSSAAKNATQFSKGLRREPTCSGTCHPRERLVLYENTASRSAVSPVAGSRKTPL